MTMRAAVITEFGGPEVIAIEQRPAPTPGDWEIAVQVHASALNRADLLQRRGLYPAPAGAPADIPGLEIAGVVEAIGQHVTRFSVGDPVMAVVAGGGCADLCLVHEREAIARPAGLPVTDCAAIPEAFMTAFDAIILQGGLRSGQWLALNAAGSGVGTAAIQIARAIGARSIGSSRTDAKLTRASALGLNVPVLGDTDALARAAKTQQIAASVALELVGGPQLGAMMKTLRPQGTCVLVGLMGGVKAELFLPAILRKRLHLVGTVLRSRAVEEKIAVARAFEDQLVPLFTAGSGRANEAPRLRPVVDKVFPLSQIADAHAYMETNANFGKIVIDHQGPLAP